MTAARISDDRRATSAQADPDETTLQEAMALGDELMEVITAVLCAVPVIAAAYWAFGAGGGLIAWVLAPIAAIAIRWECGR